MKLFLVLAILWLPVLSTGQGLRLGNGEPLRKPSTSDSLYKEGKAHVGIGAALCVAGPTELVIGLRLLGPWQTGRQNAPT
jgi:hypothetical protein